MSKERKFRILIVDDVPKNIQVAANILQKEGYQMAFAQNGKAALSQIQNNRFDLILLDIMMPDMDGFEVCGKIKTDPATKDVPIIFLTAKTDTESIVRGFDLGAIDYVTKPFKGAELLARVKTQIELYRTREELREANATKDKFFSIIAHDLKNPFNALISFSKLLITQYERFDDEKRKQFIKTMYDSSEHAYKLLENLLDWSRIQTGTIEWNPELFDLKHITDETISLLKTGAQNKNIVISSFIKENTIVFADSDMITLVIRNLLSNALKFTHPNGKIQIASNPVEDIEEIVISDTGVGMQAEDIQKIFRIDVHHSTIGTAKEQGTGLGLILCREFIEKNGGRIWVESVLGKGSDFKFTLPKKCDA